MSARAKNASSEKAVAATAAKVGTAPRGPGGVWMALSGVGVVAVVALVSWLVSGTIRTEREAQQFATSAVVAVSTSWDPAELARIADPEFMKAMPEAEMRKFIQGVGIALGPGVRLGATRGKVAPQKDTPQGKTTIGEFVSEVECTSGTATIRQTIVKQGGVWLVRSFLVDSKDIKPPR
jgi:hypothetical protein